MMSQNSPALTKVAEYARDWSLANGLIMRAVSNTHDSSSSHPINTGAIVAPLTLFPSRIPRSCFIQAISLQTSFNALYARIAVDDAWFTPTNNHHGDLGDTLHGGDEFLTRLWSIHNRILSTEGFVNANLDMGIFRSDYMLYASDSHNLPNHTNKPSIRQVEFNTVAASFMGLSGKTSHLHAELTSNHIYTLHDNTGNQTLQSHQIPRPDELPANEPVKIIAQGLAHAHTLYTKEIATVGALPCILFVVQRDERNYFDQRCIEVELKSSYNIHSVRVDLSDISAQCKVNEQRKLLVSYGNQEREVSIVYFRAGYAPAEYTGKHAEDIWTGRWMIERSAAIKCPSIMTQIAGSKKVQQALMKATVNDERDDQAMASDAMKRFCPDDDVRQRLTSTFMPMYAIHDTRTLEHDLRTRYGERWGDKFVIKAQSEGGGNNIFGHDAIECFFRQFNHDNISDRTAQTWVLMRLIEVPAVNLPVNAMLLKDGQVWSGRVVNELGTYGVCIWRRSQEATVNEPDILMNEYAGYLLRTKQSGHSETGVAAGFGVLDSCWLA